MRKDYCKDLEAASSYYDIILYRMCLEDKPKHNEEQVIAGKLLLIGRTYAASPERGAGKASGTDSPDFFRWLAKAGNWAKLDEKLSALSEEKVFGPDSLRAILQVHQFLVEMLSALIRKRNSEIEPRKHTSFCSKYLHFHKPDHFPIYDSYVAAAIAREPGISKPITTKNKYDARYSRFCQQLLEYQENNSALTLRDLDRELYHKERKHRARQTQQ